jgi:hypothetical protein
MKKTYQGAELSVITSYCFGDPIDKNVIGGA